MGKIYDHLDEKLTAFIKEQKMFFVASAPLSGEGHVNVSPKGYDSFIILGPNKVAFVDIGGSGIETHAHAQENGRITLMFCAFKGKANILRLYGNATVYDFAHPEFKGLVAQFPDFGKVRAVFVIDVTRIQDSCGWGIPFYDYVSDRDQLKRSENHRDYDSWVEHRYNTNSESIDGLPGLVRPKK